jgi:hypothetical protein
VFSVCKITDECRVSMINGGGKVKKKPCVVHWQRQWIFELSEVEHEMWHE